MGMRSVSVTFPCYIIMPFGGSFYIRYFYFPICIAKQLATYRTAPVFYVSFRKTACLHSCMVGQCMWFHRNHDISIRNFRLSALIRKIFPTNRAVPILRISCRCAGCLLPFMVGQRMWFYRNHDISVRNFCLTSVIRKFLPTYGAVPILFSSRLRTVCRFPLVMGKGMGGNRNFRIRNLCLPILIRKFLPTDRTVPILLNPRLRTVCRFPLVMGKGCTVTVKAGEDFHLF